MNYNSVCKEIPCFAHVLAEHCLKSNKGLSGCQTIVADQIICETNDRMGQSFSQTMNLPVNVDYKWFHKVPGCMKYSLTISRKCSLRQYNNPFIVIPQQVLLTQIILPGFKYFD